MKTLILIISIFLSTSALASKEKGTVGTLLVDCKKQETQVLKDAYDLGFCHGAIILSMNYLGVISNFAGTFYLPKNIDADQLRAIFVKWAENHPERWHEPDYIGIISAVHESFPIKQSNKN